MPADLPGPSADETPRAIDTAAGIAADTAASRRAVRPAGLPFEITKIGHVVLNVADLARSTDFYTRILGFRVSDVYPESMMPGGMVFMRCNTDHHGVALVGRTDSSPRAVVSEGDLHHLAFAVSSLDEVILARDHLRRHDVPIDFEGRRRAGVQIAVEFRDPDGNRLEIYWGLDQVGSDGIVRPEDQWKGARSLAQAIAEPVVGQDTTLRDRTLKP